MPTKKAMYGAIVDFVEAERKRLKIKPKELGTSSRFEGSCFATGEFRNLIWAQLLYTHEGYGDWLALIHADILQGAFDEVQATKNERLVSAT